MASKERVWQKLYTDFGRTADQADYAVDQNWTGAFDGDTDRHVAQALDQFLDEDQADALQAEEEDGDYDENDEPAIDDYPVSGEDES